ncbi:MAG: S-layer homology domain-containing protein [Candidatus Melainabacteria bacterium]|nr:S-layer homology domain-containing protein [Candidatus Melainabacteria bacterium]
MSVKNNLVLAIVIIFCGQFFVVDKVFAQAAKQRDASVVSVSELKDLQGDEWAYGAVQQLVEKYDVLEGYPDGTYKGKKPSTRFELAAAVYDLATYFSDEIALDRDDLAKLAKLLDEFSGEIKTLQGKVDALETKVSGLDTKVTGLETKTTTLEGQLVEHKTLLDEHEKRLAYAERRKGFILERLIKGLVVDARDLSRGVFAAVTAPFNKKISDAISK